jgi:hypothetical protein
MTHITLSFDELFALLFAAIVFYLAVYVMGYYRAVKRLGLMSEMAMFLPDHMLFTVIHSDKICTVLRETTGKKRTWTVNTQVFAGKPIRPKDFVRRLRDTIEAKDLNIEIPQPFDVLVVDNSAKE